MPLQKPAKRVVHGWPGLNTTSPQTTERRIAMIMIGSPTAGDLPFTDRLKGGFPRRQVGRFWCAMSRASGMPVRSGLVCSNRDGQLLIGSCAAMAHRWLPHCPRPWALNTLLLAWPGHFGD